MSQRKEIFLFVFLIFVLLVVKIFQLLAGKGYLVYPFPQIAGTFAGLCFIVWFFVKSRQDALDKPVVAVSLVSDEDAGVTGKKKGEKVSDGAEPKAAQKKK